MAEVIASDSNTKALEVEEKIEGDRIDTKDYFFCNVGAAISVLSDDSTYDTNDLPSQPLVVSQRFGLMFVAHSSGFFVARTKDVMDAAKEIKDKGSGSSVQELSFVDVSIGRVSILALSFDSSYIYAVVGGEIQCFLVDSLLKKDTKPMLSCTVESNCVKDLLWIKDTEASFIVLTDNGNLLVGSANKSLKHVVNEVDAVGRSMDGSFVAVARKYKLSIFSPKFKEIKQILLPIDVWTGESAPIKVDSIKWVRSDSIVVGCFQQTDDGSEENYFIQVIMSKDGRFIDDSPTLASVYFFDLFAGVVDDILPFGCGPYLLVNYLENCELAFVSNRKNTDQHIILFDWSQGDNQVSVVDIERDRWLPRIHLQENGDDNLVLGLCVDKSSVYENVKVQIGVEEETELRPHCVLLCLTLEGKLVMYYVASTAGSQSSSRDSSFAASNAQSIPVAGPSDLGEDPSRLEEEKSKQSTLDLGLHVPDGKAIRSVLDEVPVEKDQKPPEQNKYTLGTPTFDHINKKELVSGKNDLKVVADVNDAKPFEHSGKSGEGASNLVSFKTSQDGPNFVAGDSFATEKWKIDRGNLTSIGRSVEKKIESDVLSSTSTPTNSSRFLGSSGVCIEKPLFPSPDFAKTTLSGSRLTLTDKENSSASLFGNFGSPPLNSFGTSTGKAVNDSQKPISGSGVSVPHSFPSSKKPFEGDKLSNFTGQSAHQIQGNEKKSSPLRQMNPVQNLTKQSSNVQNMVHELDKLLASIEEAGGFRDACTTAHRGSLEALEDRMDNISERNRVWQSCMEERLREIQLLLDKTVQVLARKTHLEGIVRQSTDGQYWELWNRQKLNLELDQKRRNVLNRNQDLINQMIELEKHFNTLEMNLFGESSGVNLASWDLKSRSAPSRHRQSLHAIHNATISQLAAANQLSDSLSKQMAILSIKSPQTKQANVKKQVFESIGIPYPDDSLCSPNTVKVMESPSNRLPLVSCSGGTRNESRRTQLSGVSSHDLETARRRRDSLDRNWANFEAPKTTVKRMVVQNERPKSGSLLPSMNKQFLSPGKLESSVATYSKDLVVKDKNGFKDAPQKLSSDTAAESKFKWAGGVPEFSHPGTEQRPRWKTLQGDNFSISQNTSSSASSSSSSSSSSSLSVVDLNVKKGNIFSTAERPGTQIGIIDKSGSNSVNTKPSVLQFSEEKPTDQKIQPQLFSFPIKSGQAPTSSSKESELAKSVGVQIFTDVSTSQQGIKSSPSPVFAQVSSTSLPNLTKQTLPRTSEFTISTKMSKDVQKEVVQFPTSTFSATSSLETLSSSVTSRDIKDVQKFPTSAIPVTVSQVAPVASVSSVSSKDTKAVDSDSAGSSVNSAKELLKTGPQAAAKEISEGNNLATTSLSPEKLATSTSAGLNFAQLMTSPSTEVSKPLASSSDMNKTGTPGTPVFGVVSITPEKQSTAVTLSPASPSEFGGATGGKSNIDVGEADQDEMEEEAPETNQAADLSLGSFSGFGIGSAPSATAPRSNPFGGPITSAPQTMPSSSSLTVPSGELFRPASFSFQSLLPSSQPSQSTNVGAPSGAFGFTNPQQTSAGSGFGQPSQIGSGQQALGSVLGSFGQSRQIGAGLPGSGFGVPQSLGGGFSGISATGGGFVGMGSTGSGFAGGFATAATSGGGFAAAATGGGFAAAAAAPIGGGFAAAAPSGGGFAAAAGGGGFASAAPSGGGFAAAAGGAGGFGAFNNSGASGFSGFGGAAGGRPAPSQLFTQMRK